MPRGALVAALVMVGPPTAFAATGVAEQFKLPSIRTRAGAGPPFVTRVLPPERIFPRPISSEEQVIVGMNRTGSPHTIDVRQRLTVHGRGDYSFVVRAPLALVRRAPGSQSDPGQRRGLILWQGFSPGNRVLAADARLVVRRAAPNLPLRVRVRREGGRVHILVRNDTAMRVRTFAGVANPVQTAAVLDELRGAVERDVVPPGRIVAVRGSELRMTSVHVAFAVRGIVTASGLIGAPSVTGGQLRRVSGREVRFDARLGRPRPLRLTFLLRPGVPPPRLRLTAAPSTPGELLSPPSSRAWRDAVGAGRAPGPRRLFARTLDAIHAVARWRRYNRFLENPDALGAGRTIYLYRTAGAPVMVHPTLRDESHENGLLMPVLVLGAGLAAIAGLTVLWAHS